MRKRIICEIAVIIYAIGIAYMVTRWAFHCAYLERGYEAIGGEILIPPVALLMAYRIGWFFIEGIQEVAYEYRRNNKRRGRRTVRVRDNRRTIH